jgi:hypothetical protein
MVLLVMVMADMAMEYGTRIDVAVWMMNRPEKATCNGRERPFSTSSLWPAREGHVTST